MFGGAVLGRGSYGCVVSPSPRCETTDPAVFHANTNLVSKFIYRPDTVESESDGYKRITEIDPYHNFSLAAYRYYDDLDVFDPKFPCKVRSEDVDPTDALACGMTLTPGTKFDAFVYEKFKGEAFRKFIGRTDVIDMQKVLVIMRLLFALSVMEGRVTHYDLHGDNVMVSLFPVSASTMVEPPAPDAAAAGGGGAEVELPPLTRSKGVTPEYTLLAKAFEANELTLNSTLENFLDYLEAAGVPKGAASERAASDFYDTIKTVYFRATERRPWRDYLPVATNVPNIDNLRPVLIDYGMLDTVTNRAAKIMTEPGTVYFQYYPLEYYILRSLLRDTARTRDFVMYARAYVSKIDYSRRTYNPALTRGQRGTPMPWKLISKPMEFDYETELSMSMLPHVLEGSFLRFEATIKELYGSTDGDDFVRDLAEFLAVKQDMTAIMMYLVNWKFKPDLPPAARTLCEEIVRAARLSTCRRPFERPLPHQVYNHLIPFCKAVGLTFEKVTIKSEPFETFEVIGSTMEKDKAVFAESIPKVPYSRNKLLMRNVEDVEMFSIDLRDKRFKRY